MELQIADAVIAGTFSLPTNSDMDVKTMVKKLKDKVEPYNSKDTPIKVNRDCGWINIVFQLKCINVLDFVHNEVESVIEDHGVEGAKLNFTYHESIVPEDWYFKDANGYILHDKDYVQVDGDDTLWEVYSRQFNYDNEPVVYVCEVGDTNKTNDFLASEVKVKNELNRTTGR